MADTLSRALADRFTQNELGEPFILDVSDDAPFFSFGQVDPGQTQATLYNNLVRAPLFKQEARHGDFLLIRYARRVLSVFRTHLTNFLYRHISQSNIQYFLRSIPHVFTVGQLLPAVTIPGPYARLATNTVKTRLHMIAHKLVQRSEKERIKIHRIMRYFPDQNELQMRQRLKVSSLGEFADHEPVD